MRGCLNTVNYTTGRRLTRDEAAKRRPPELKMPTQPAAATTTPQPQQRVRGAVCSDAQTVGRYLVALRCTKPLTKKSRFSLVQVVDSFSRSVVLNNISSTFPCIISQEARNKTMPPRLPPLHGGWRSSLWDTKASHNRAIF